MTERTSPRTDPWWRKALKAAWVGVRSGFGLFAKAGKPASNEAEKNEAEKEEEKVFVERSQTEKEVESPLSKEFPKQQMDSAEAQKAGEETRVEAPLQAAEPETASDRATAEAVTSAESVVDTAVEAATAEPEVQAGAEPATETPAAEPEAVEAHVEEQAAHSESAAPEFVHPEELPETVLDEAEATAMLTEVSVEEVAAEAAAAVSAEEANDEEPAAAMDEEALEIAPVDAKMGTDAVAESAPGADEANAQKQSEEVGGSTADSPGETSIHMTEEPMAPESSEPAAAKPQHIPPAAPEEAGGEVQAPAPAQPQPPTAVAAPTGSTATAQPAKKLIKLEARGDDSSPFSVLVEEVYDGPLDLLLDLIRKQDIDIYDIPIARITAQFLAYVNQLRAGDVDVAGEFIYTASLLIHIKSKMLLPRTAAGPEEATEDPRRELVERLLEHERFRNAAQMLQQKQMLEAATWSNPGVREFREDAEAEPEIAADTVDLVRIFREILERARNRPVLDVQEDSVTVGQMIQFLARRLTMEDKPIALRRLLSHTHSERALIAMFLGLLELVRLQAILLRQDKAFSEIFVKKHSGFDALMNQGLAGSQDDWR